MSYHILVTIELPDGKRVEKFFLRPVSGPEKESVFGRFDINGSDRTIKCRKVIFKNRSDMEKADYSEDDFLGFVYIE